MLVQLSRGWSAAVPPAPPILEPAPGEAPARGPTDIGDLQIRPARIADMRQVQPLIHGFAAANLMLPKSFDQLARNFREFVVAERPDGQIVGCGALRVYTEELAEICSLAVDPPYQHAGVGRLIVDQLVENAREIQIATVFALTLRPEFFGRLGFSVVPREDFPLKVWADCRTCPKLHACDEIAVARPV